MIRIESLYTQVLTQSCPLSCPLSPAWSPCHTRTLPITVTTVGATCLTADTRLTHASDPTPAWPGHMTAAPYFPKAPGARPALDNSGSIQLIIKAGLLRAVVAAARPSRPGLTSASVSWQHPLKRTAVTTATTWCISCIAIVRCAPVNSRSRPHRPPAGQETSTQLTRFTTQCCLDDSWRALYWRRWSLFYYID